MNYQLQNMNFLLMKMIQKINDFLNILNFRIYIKEKDLIIGIKKIIKKCK